MARRKCSARVGYMSLSDMGFSPIKPCPKNAVVVETHTVKKTVYVNAYCERHRTSLKNAADWKVKVEQL